ncbi:hypothetical protein [Spongiactinospora sp. TRM90649]|uniref:hypothetical protein n=1 Tax=Spongiactinospora sp. TRM90649 TaxID=3031114 RepID=UPI0023F9DB3A|nr:hypothetical protein [Spongiactinospora sp. TRM90649]MDF5751239.1 hypothetical protein [Spongiactinospora sp. TRM90649]
MTAGTITTLGAGATARLFVRLKLRLVGGNLRGDLSRQLGFAFTLAVALVLALGGFALMALLRLAPHDVAANVGVIAYTMIFLSWAVVPLLLFGVDDTLDPAKLALFPVRTGPLAAGLFAASATGPWPLATLIVCAGAVAGLATSPVGAVLGVLAVLLQFALCVVTSRAITTGLSGALRSRRGRDILAVSAILVVLAVQLPNLLLNQGMSGDPRLLLENAASLLRWTPSGMAAHAVADGGAVALAEIAALAVIVALITWLWMAALRRALVTPDSSTQGGGSGVRRSRGGVARLLPDGPIAAVVAKDLKYARRDPRGRISWLAAIMVSVVISFSLTRDTGAQGTLAAVVGPACLGALVMGMQSANAFSLDGRALWMNAVVYGSPRALRTDFAGRHLAVATLAAPLIAIVSVVASVLAGNVLWALPAVLTAWGLFAIALGVGAVVSVLLPYTTPDRLNAFTGAAPGQGGVALAGSLLTMIVTSVLSLLIALPVLLGLPWVSLAALPYGLLIAWTGRRLAGTIGHSRLPEIIAAVSRPT